MRTSTGYIIFGAISGKILTKHNSPPSKAPGVVIVRFESRKDLKDAWTNDAHLSCVDSFGGQVI